MKYIEVRRVNLNGTFVDLPDYESLTFDSIWSPAPSVINLSYPLAAGIAAGLAPGAFIAVLPDGTEIPDRYVIETLSKVTVSDSGLIGQWAGRSLKALLEDDFVWPSAWPNPVPQGHAFIDSTSGTILKTFLTRSNARGIMTALTHTSFSGTTDSNGVAWGTIVDRNFANGQTILQVAQNLYDAGMLDLRTNGFALEAYKGGTFARHLSIDSVCFTAGLNIADESAQIDASNFFTDVLMEGEGAATTATDSGSYSTIGRRRARYSSAGGISDPGTLALLASADLSQFTHINQERSLGVSHQTGQPQPFANYRAGDWVWLDVDGTPVEIQIQQIAVQAQKGALPRVALTLGDLLDSSDEALKRKIDAITGGNSGNYGPIPGTTGAQPNLAPAAPTGLGAVFGVYVDDKGFNRVAGTFTWNEVTTNSDSTPATDIGSYELFMRDDSTSAVWQLISKAEAGNPVAFYSPLPENTFKRFRVIAIDTSGARSAPGAEYRVSTPADSTPPNVPSTPTGSVTRGVVTVNWDGNDSGGVNLVTGDFKHVVLYRSTISNFTLAQGTRMETFLAKSSATFSDQPYGTPYYYRLAAVDVTGNQSALSAQFSATTTGLVSADLGQALNDEIDLAQSTATSAGTTASNAQTLASAALPKIITVGTYKNFLQVAGYGNNVANQTGTIVIDTPITFSNYMTRVHIAGFNYVSGASEIDVTLSGYIYSVGPLFINSAQTTLGSTAVTARWARNIATGTASILLDTGSGVWQYPKITVDRVEIGQTTPPDSFGTGWTISLKTDLSGYDLVTAVAKRDLNDTNALTQGWRTTGQTTIDGGKVTADSITATQMSANSIGTVELQADSVNAQKVQAASIGSKQLIVADLSNMAEVNETSAGAVTYSGWSHIIETVSGVRWSKRDLPASNQYFMFRNNNGPLPFKDGDRVRLTFEAYAGANVTAQPYVWTYGTSNTTTAMTAVNASPTTITTTPQTFQYEVVIPNTVGASGATTYLVGLTGVTSSDLRVRNVRAFVMNAGELIVDGTVTANKIVSIGQSQVTGLSTDLAAKSTGFLGTNDTTPSSGMTAGDTYTNTVTGKQWVYSGSAWVANTDPTKAKGFTGTTDTPAGSGAIAGDTYTNTTNGKQWVYSGSAWVLIVDATKSKTIVGTTDTTPASGMVAGDVYINTSNGKQWVYSGSVWVAVLDPTKSKTFTGTSDTPTGSGAIAGDIYVNTTNGRQWIYSGSAWVPVVDVTKTATFTGTTNTTPSSGMKTGDIYLNTTTGAQWVYSGSAWVAVADPTKTTMTAVDAAYSGTKTLVNTWVAPDNTTIKGGMIQTGSIQAIAIGAHVIGADQLVVGGVTNLMPDGYGEYGVSADLVGTIFEGSTGVTMQNSDLPAASGVQAVYVGPNSTSTKVGANRWIDAEPGQEYLVEIWAKASVANSRLTVELRDQAGNNASTVVASTASGDIYAGSGANPVNALTVPTMWTKYTAVATIASGVTRFKIGSVFFNQTGGAVTNAVQSIAIRIRQRGAGRLIVDGSITALKLSANSVDTDKLVAGAITAEKLALGVRGTNLVPDPSFEDTQPVASPTNLPAVMSDTGWYSDSIGTSGGALHLRRLRGRSGAWSLSAYLNGAGGTSSARSGAIPVVPGQSYKFVFYAMTTNASYGLIYELYGGSTATGTTTLQTLNPDFETEPTLNVNSTPEPFDPTDYTVFSFDYVAPAGINFVRARLGNTHATATGSVIFDDVSLILKGATAAELTPAGLRLFDDEGMEVGAFVSNRPNYFTVSRGGAEVASVGEDGAIAGLSGSFVGSDIPNALGDTPGALTVGGVDYADRMASLPQGAISQVYRSSLVSVTNIRTEYGIYEFAFTAQPGRHYRIAFTGGTVRANTGAPTVSAIARIRRTLDGTTPTITNGAVVRSTWVGLPTNNVDVSIPPIIVQGESTGGSSTEKEVRFLYTLNALNAGATDWISFSNKGGTSAPAPIECVVEDLGMDPQDVYQGSSGGGTLYTGGTTTEPTTSPTTSKRTYTQTWVANSSQTRRGTSSFGNNTVNTAAPSGYNLAGYFSGSNGNQYTYMGFTGTGSLGQTISSAISGATVTKVELYVKNAKFYGSSGGNQRFSITTLGSMPSSGVASATLGVSGAYTPNLTFTPGQGRWLVLNSTAVSTVVGGGRVAIIGPGATTSNSYYSTWYDHVGSGAPQLRITYTK